MNNRNILILRMILFGLLTLFVIGFWGELRIYVGWIVAGHPPITPEIARARFITLMNFWYFFALCLTWFVIFSCQAIFPVRGPLEATLTALYLILYCLGLHGVAAYVRNGKIKAFVEELQLHLPGAVMVDFNSALAVEQVVIPPGFLHQLIVGFRRLLAFLGFNSSTVRIRGAGLVFTLPDERIYGVNDLESHPVTVDDPHWMSRILGVVDLRPQFRTSARQPHPLSKRLGTPVFAYTRDGIEVKTNISVVATLGQEPVPYFPLSIAYVGERHPRNLRVVKFKKISDEADFYRLESFSNELDQWDRLEIHEQWQTISTWVPYGDPPRSPLTPQFNLRRVFAAIYARARHHLGFVNTDEIVPWYDLPIHVAVDLFREIISRYNYDEIYEPDESGNMRINQIRGELGAAMRNSGILSYRPIRHRTGACLEAGTRYFGTNLLTVTPANALSLRSSKVLRDRGIRIITAGFGDLSVDERIYKQRLDHWRAAWDRETEVMEAGLEWESVRVRTRARIQAQRDFVQYLTQIYRSDGNSKEILALRVLQALEAAAADSKTRQLLPEETFSMLRSIHDWLLPEDIGYNSGSGAV